MGSNGRSSTVDSDMESTRGLLEDDLNNGSDFSPRSHQTQWFQPPDLQYHKDATEYQAIFRQHDMLNQKSKRKIGNMTCAVCMFAVLLIFSVVNMILVVDVTSTQKKMLSNTGPKQNESKALLEIIHQILLKDDTKIDTMLQKLDNSSTTEGKKLDNILQQLDKITLENKKLDALIQILNNISSEGTKLNTILTQLDGISANGKTVQGLLLNMSKDGQKLDIVLKQLDNISKESQTLNTILQALDGISSEARKLDTVLQILDNISIDDKKLDNVLQKLNSIISILGKTTPTPLPEHNVGKQMRLDMSCMLLMMLMAGLIR